MSKFLITTAIDYPNDVIHLGHSYQKVMADFLARYHRQKGDETYFLTGDDEYGGKVEEAAKVAGISPKEWTDQIAEKNQVQWQSLGLSYDRFFRTTDDDHKKVVTDFWRKCRDNGDIYLGNFAGLYCLGCEEYKKEKDLKEGKCPLHPKKEIQILEEKNYFFSWSKYRDWLIELLTNKKGFVLPESRKKEMLMFLEEDLQDIAISRPKEKIGWGIPVPDDDTHIIYVWFDALINYFTSTSHIGFWDNETKIIHILGKDNTRWHALLWPAMLKSAGYRIPDTIFTHDFINLSGQKISKSLGNIIRPKDLADIYGGDAIRYFLLRYGPQNGDADLSLEKLKIVYEAELANDWGNLVSRLANLAFREDIEIQQHEQNFDEEYCGLIENFKIIEAISLVFSWVRNINEEINKIEPWKLKKGDKLTSYLKSWINDVYKIAFHLTPVMPKSSVLVMESFSTKVKKVDPLFPKNTTVQ